MTNDNKIPTMSDADLDGLLDSYTVPAFDEAAFNTRLMAAINQDSPQAASSNAFVWFRPAKYMMAAIAVVFAAVLYFQAEGPSNVDGNSIMAEAPSDQMASPDERMIVASAGVAAADDAQFDDMFYAEMADQDILLTDYVPEGYDDGAYDADSANTADVPAIDEFLDDLLGIESRQL